MEQVSITTTTKTLTATAQEVLAANANRKYLSLHNKGACNILIKYGSDFGGANDEVQIITFTPAAAPSAGAFKISYAGNKTASITYDKVAADIQTALRMVAGCSGVTVDGSFADGFTITFAGAEAQTNVEELLVTDNTLATDALNVDEVQTLDFSATPTTGTYKLTFGAETTGFLNYNSDAAAVQAALRGLTGLSAVTVADASEGFGFVVTFAGSHEDADLIVVDSRTNTLADETVQSDEIQEIYMNQEPTEGTFKLQYGEPGYGEQTSALNYNATAAEVQAALRLLSGIYGGVTVAGTCFQKVKQVATNTVNVLEDFPYEITSALKVYTYTPPSGAPANASVVVAALLALINAEDDELFVATLGGTAPNQTLKLTAKTAGVAFTATPSENITTVATTANNRGMTVDFTGSDGYVNQPLIQPYDVDLKRHGEEVIMAVYTATEGAYPGAVGITVTETVKGIDDQDMTASVATPTQGLAYQNEGTPLAPGTKISTDSVCPIDSVWAMCDEDEALLEIQEG
jgi:hypothetical protein